MTDLGPRVTLRPEKPVPEAGAEAGWPGVKMRVSCRGGDVSLLGTLAVQEEKEGRVT